VMLYEPNIFGDLMQLAAINGRPLYALPRLWQWCMRSRIL
jgi:hypothetical protein